MPAGPVDVCRARGIACTLDEEWCDATGCVSGYCGGDAPPHSVYPLLGGAFPTIDEGGATCDFDFFKVRSDFKLFDTGFRCCFDENPGQ